MIKNTYTAFGKRLIKHIFAIIKLKRGENIFNAVDLFCGAGGLSLGFEMAGFNILAGFEIDAACLKTYSSSHKNTLLFKEDLTESDILKLLNNEGIESGDVDVVIGGPPCQGFSMLGKRIAGDERNSLVRIYADIIRKIRPKMFLMENVAGLTSMKNEKNTSFKEELSGIFNSIGYNVTSKILLAADFGVPQMRKRLFFVGVKKDYPYNFKFPQKTSKKYLTVSDALSDLPRIESGEHVNRYDKPSLNPYQRYSRYGSKKLHNHRAAKHSKLVIERIKNIPPGGNHSDLPDFLKLKRGYANIYGKLDSLKPASTITANCGCASAPGKFIHPECLRVITVREASRLQSFPDSVVFKGTKSQQYRQVGNAVPPLLSKAVAGEVKKALTSIL